MLNFAACMGQMLLCRYTCLAYGRHADGVASSNHPCNTKDLNWTDCVEKDVWSASVPCKNGKQYSSEASFMVILAEYMTGNRDDPDAVAAAEQIMACVEARGARNDAARDALLAIRSDASRDAGSSHPLRYGYVQCAVLPRCPWHVWRLRYTFHRLLLPLRWYIREASSSSTCQGSPW